jgi:hypothetical protein
MTTPLHAAVVLLYALLFAYTPNAYKHIRTRSRVVGLKAAEEADPSFRRDLTGYKLWTRFDGFGVQNMTCSIELKDKFVATFGRGIETNEPGLWRVIKYNDGKETVECVQPVLAEYMYLFDLWEPNVLWRGTLDMQANRVVDGEVIANKKRFGVIPYTEIISTWTADIYAPGISLPDVRVPSMKAQR